MCRSESRSEGESSSPETSSRLQQREGFWQFTVDIKAQPNVDLSESSVRIEVEGSPEILLPVPSHAQPIDLEASRVSFSRKKGTLTVSWPAQSRAAVSDDSAKTPTLPSENCAASGKEVIKAEEANEDAPSKGAPPSTEECRGQGSDAAKAEEVTVEDSTKAPTRTAEEWKAAGNEAVKAGDHAAAFESYTAGLAVEPEHAMILSNRALCLQKLGRLEEALADAERCNALRPDFVKGYLRGATILRELKRPREAFEFLRRSPPNDEVEKMAAELKPAYEAAEAERIAALGGAERRKEEGNALFKKGLVEQALKAYGEALDMCADPASDLALTIRNNRANCHHQLSNFHGVVEDSTFVLEHQPENLKALIRRMIALEPLEKYERALADARQVLRHVPGHEVANRMQHRLSKLVRDLARERS